MLAPKLYVYDDVNPACIIGSLLFLISISIPLNLLLMFNILVNMVNCSLFK